MIPPFVYGGGGGGGGGGGYGGGGGGGGWGGGGGGGGGAKLTKLTFCQIRIQTSFEVNANGYLYLPS